MAYKYSGRIIRAGKAWTDNDGIQHPIQLDGVGMHATKAAKGRRLGEMMLLQLRLGGSTGRLVWPRSLDDVNEVDAEGNAVLDARRCTARHAGPEVQRYCFW
jgi:hypothetical protein